MQIPNPQALVGNTNRCKKPLQSSSLPVSAGKLKQKQLVRIPAYSPKQSLYSLFKVGLISGIMATITLGYAYIIIHYTRPDALWRQIIGYKKASTSSTQSPEDLLRSNDLSSGLQKNNTNGSLSSQCPLTQKAQPTLFTPVPTEGDHPQRNYIPNLPPVSIPIKPSCFSLEGTQKCTVCQVYEKITKDQSLTLRISNCTLFNERPPCWHLVRPQTTPQHNNRASDITQRFTEIQLQNFYLIHKTDVLLYPAKNDTECTRLAEKDAPPFVATNNLDLAFLEHG